MINDETAVRIMIYEIRDKNPGLVPFVVTPELVKSMLFYLQTRKYDTIMYIYGYKFLLAIMHMFEEAENYEECQEILNQIEYHNKVLKDDIPTKF